MAPLRHRYVVVTGSRVSFLSGAACLWDFAGSMYPHVRLNSGLADKSVAEGLAEEWAAVGRDMWMFLPAEEDAELVHDAPI